MATPSESQRRVKQFWADLLNALQRLRNIRIDVSQYSPPSSSTSIPDILTDLSSSLKAHFRTTEADTVLRVRELVTESRSFGGLGLNGSTALTDGDYQETLFLVEAWLQALTSQERSKPRLATVDSRSPQTRPMTLAQKIFAQHVIGGSPIEGLQPGDVVRVAVDWILASELSWSSMERVHKEMGAPEIWRNDRFWLAGDHVVHPEVAHQPKIQNLIDVSEKAKKNFKMTEYQGMNYTIMHTEFVRERAEPGMLCIGSDSHTCSGGAVGSLSIGLGSADVMMTLTLGETWFKIPESIRIEFVGTPATGISGKDVILHILKELKRNTVAAERIVEFVGEGLQHLSCDDRFAISNMCTEFGAITGVFEPDAITQDYINRRKRKANRTNSIYFKADPDAAYAGRYTIDLSKVEASVAVYPEPDNVVPVSEMAETQLDGVFIGACTTTEEELVLAGLVLKAGLEQGWKINHKGRRHYVPGSLPIVERLRELKILDIYEAAGFTRGPPGCSFCVGLSAEKASEGETWLSSQNRNFKNRMGKGSFGHVTSAIVCAASSFGMSITDPAPLLEKLDFDFLRQYRGRSGQRSIPVKYVEPGLSPSSPKPKPSDPQTNGSCVTNGSNGVIKKGGVKNISSRITCLGDFIDTDALAPGPALVSCVTDEDFGKHVLEYTNPDFRQKVRDGQQVVVAGNAFGVGSSRECAVSALKGAGVKAVIAKSFAFIYGRNQPSLGLLGFVIEDDEFYDLAQENAEIDVNVSKRKVAVGGKSFDFKLSEIEYNLTANKGIAHSYRAYGKDLWQEMTNGGVPRSPEQAVMELDKKSEVNAKLEW